MQKLGSRKYIIGIDEVGRGSLAGPVTVAAVALPIKFRRSGSQPPLRDSKKLTPLQRERWFEYIKSRPQIFYAVSHVSPGVIDRINVSNAANQAAFRAFSRLNTRLDFDESKRAKYMLAGIPTTNLRVYLDSGLKLPCPLSQVSCPTVKTFIRGDEKFNVIKFASIVAKVTRDKYMVNLHKKIPHYQFDCHKGYGTKKHLRAIKKHGFCQIHRSTFLKSFVPVKVLRSKI